MEKICWVVAFPHEARPVIERFSLRKVKEERAVFPVYRSDDGTIALVISGLGKVLSAAATVYLASQNSTLEGNSAIWINFGIAGSGQSCFGETFVASRVTDQGSGRSWYPPAVWSKRIPVERSGVLTVDRPFLDPIEGPALIEMEAAGFFSVASKLSSLEFCHAVKVVSDDPDHSVRDLERQVVEKICSRGLEAIQPWLNDLIVLLDERNERSADPPGFEKWKGIARFSATQIHQLRRLLQEYDALGESLASLNLAPKHGSMSSKKCLELLRNQLSSIRVRIREE